MKQRSGPLGHAPDVFLSVQKEKKQLLYLLFNSAQRCGRRNRKVTRSLSQKRLVHTDLGFVFPPKEVPAYGQDKKNLFHHS